MQLIFASNNAGKRREISNRLPAGFLITNLEEAGITEAIPEPFDTFRENAWSKASYVFTKTGIPCFSEDSGLVVPALGGAPGVFSARYAGAPGNDAANNALLLARMQGIQDRAAYYQATICLLLDEHEVHYFEAQCPGTITHSPQGAGGFGYDPLFIPNGHERSFAELGLDEKNKISHRGKALMQLATFLNGRFFPA